MRAQSRTRSSGVLAVTVGVIVSVTIAWVWLPHDVSAFAPGNGDAADQRFSPEFLAEAQAYAGQARAYSVASIVTQVLLALLLIAAAWRRWIPAWVAQRRGGFILAVVGVLVLQRLVSLPWSLLALQHRRDFGLSVQSTPAYFKDLGLGFAIDAIVTVLVVALVLVCLRRVANWPLVLGTGVAGLIAFGSFVYPVVITPLFNDFTPLQDSRLSAQIEAAAERADVELGGVEVVDASRRTTTLNAYVAGFGSSRQVVLYDTMLDQLSDAEIVSIAAHELTHARHDDVLWGTALGAAASLALIGMIGVAWPRAASWVRTPYAAANVVVAALAVSVVAGLVVAPVQNAMSRRVEMRADIEGLANSDDPRAAVAVQRALVLKSKSEPDPPALWHWWFGSHPTALERLQFIDGYSAARNAQTGR